MRPGTTLRIARPSARLEAVAAMYKRGLGFTVLARFQDRDGYRVVLQSREWTL